MGNPDPRDRIEDEEIRETAPSAAAPTTPSGGARPPFYRRPLLYASLLVFLAAFAGAYVLLTSSDEAAAEVILEPSAAPADDPFTDSVATEEVELTGGEVEQVSGGGASVESVDGSAPGLYGGTGEEAVCDAEQMIAFLSENPDKAAAFAEAVGTTAKKLPDYIAGLTPVLLREDTRVTNHGFVSGAANPFQAVLQAGTAVMVDERGVPRVRCECGNPLAEPAAAEGTPEFSGERWESFDDQRLAAVSPAAEPIETFELTNVETGEIYEQPAGGIGGDPRDLVFDFGGVGTIRIGMTPSEASEASGLDVEFGDPVNSAAPDCQGVSIGEVGGPLNGLTLDGKTISYLASSDEKASTTAGVGVGSTAEEVEQAYDRTRREPIPVNPALEQVVAEEGDNAFVFSTDESGRVTHIRVGRTPDVFEPEGCL